MLGDGVNIRDLAEYLGHDAAITLRVYGHLQRAATKSPARRWTPACTGHVVCQAGQEPG
jgi:hypothetical protein